MGCKFTSQLSAGADVNTSYPLAPSSSRLTLTTSTFSNNKLEIAVSYKANLYTSQEAPSYPKETYTMAFPDLNLFSDSTNSSFYTVSLSGELEAADFPLYSEAGDSSFSTRQSTNKTEGQTSTRPSSPDLRSSSRSPHDRRDPKSDAIDGQDSQSLSFLGVQFEDGMDFKLDIAEFEHSCKDILADVAVDEGNPQAASCLARYYVSEYSDYAVERNLEEDRDIWGWWLSQ